MENQQETTDMFTNFYERYISETDAQILKILQNHKDYQEVAVQAVAKIAIERGLIHSEQDLLAPEFQKTRNSGFSLFPAVANDWHQKRLVDSITRFLYLFSLLPIVFGVMSYAKGETDRTIEGIALGLIWALLCLIFRKSRNNVILVLLFSILAGCLTVIFILIFNQKPIKGLDILMTIVGTALPAYMLLYLKQLLKAKTDDK